jgi:hypothetical protein
MPASTRVLPAVGLALFFVTAGCGKPSTGLAEVSGTVKFDGKPVSGVVVTFYPIVAPGEPRQAFSRATTDAVGKYTLMSEDGKPGAVVGKHKVVVSWPVRSGHEVAKSPPPFAIPLRYTVVAETPIEKQVNAGPNSIDIDVNKQ